MSNDDGITIFDFKYYRAIIANNSTVQAQKPTWILRKNIRPRNKPMQVS